jgi:hypothetical protein
MRNVDEKIDRLMDENERLKVEVARLRADRGQASPLP